MQKLTTVIIAIILGMVFASIAQSRTWYVKVDGTGDAPTIEAAVDSAQDGDEVIVAPGAYTWTNQSPYNGWDVMLYIPIEIWLHSESGPEVTILDAEGEGGLIIISNYDVRIQPVIEGFTLKNGSKDSFSSGAAIACEYCDPTIKDNIIVDNWTFWLGGALIFVESSAIITGNIIAQNTVAGRGGAICCWTNSQLVIRDNVIDNNLAGEDGAGIYCYLSDATIEENVITRNTANESGGGIVCWGASPTISNNVIAWNRARDECGGGIYCRDSSPEIVNNTIVSNRSISGGAIYLMNSSPTVSENILASSLEGEAVYCDSTSSPVITCNDFWNNAGGDGNCTLGGDNVSADPMFCDPAADDYHIHEDSPCAPDNSPSGCGLVGALAVDCWDAPLSALGIALVLVGAGAIGAWSIWRSRTESLR